jgi:hypothetical protein
MVLVIAGQTRQRDAGQLRSNLGMHDSHRIKRGFPRRSYLNLEMRSKGGGELSIASKI